MKNGLVSVIIPAYNSAKFIRETIESVLQQIYTSLEIIVVDDGSTDNQKEIIKVLADQDSRVKYFYQENKGVSAARNFGYEQSSGEYIAFLDADDVWLPDNLILKIEKLQSGKFGLAHSDAAIINEVSVATGQTLAGKEGNVLNDMLMWNGAQIPGPSSILVKRDVLDQVGLFDTELSTSADYDFFLRIASRFAVGRVDKITWKYRIHSNNMHKNIARMEHDVLLVYKKAEREKWFYSWSFQRRCFSTMYLILAASWAGDGNNMLRGLYFFLKGLIQNPIVAVQMVIRVIRNRS